MVMMIIRVVLTQVNKDIYIYIARREAGGGAVGAALAVHRLPVDRQT
jgi:hypothetical protein